MYKPGRLHPRFGLQRRSSGVVVCPKLEELVLVLPSDRETLNIKNVIDLAVARVSSGAKLRTIKIASMHDKLDLVDVLELRKHVWQVEHCPWVDVANEG